MNGKIDYKKWNSNKPLLQDDSCVEIINVAEFLNILSSGDIQQLNVSFAQEKQVLTCFTECLSKRSIYAWGNNLYITHVSDNYEGEDSDAWYCDISKYDLLVNQWYPVNVVTHSPWHNKTNKENTILPVNYVCLGFDQAPEIVAIGKEILPKIDDITRVSTVPEQFLNSDVTPYTEHHNKQMQHELYQFNNSNKTGWLSVVISGFLYSKDLLIMSIDKREKRRYFAFS